MPPTKRQRLAEWIQKQDSYMLSTRDPPQTWGPIQTKSEGHHTQMETK